MGASTWDDSPAPAGNGWNGNGDDSHWDADGGAPAEDNAFTEENVSRHAGVAHDGGCRNCHADGHFARDCPEPPQCFGGGGNGGGGSGACFNCGEEGHMKSECTNAPVEREFDGICNKCEQPGHRASDCPLKVCGACGERGHSKANCSANRMRAMFSALNIEDVNVEEAWDNIVTADAAKELEDIKKGIYTYAKVFDTLTFQELEATFRQAEMNTHLIAKEQELAESFTIVNFQGVKDLKYVVSFQFSDKPRRAKFAEGWPASPEENLARLAEAGIVMDSFVEKCRRCDEFGHNVRDCKQEKDETVRVPINCANCNGDGHRARDCPQPRKTFGGGCRNCGSEEHKAKECPEPRTDIECNICSEVGHMSRDCPTKPPDVCRNCGEEGHRKSDCVNERVIQCRNCDQWGHSSRECTEPRNMAKIQCRNCDEMGHESRNCKKDIDWTKVECTKCHQKGHTFRRCTNQAADVAEETGADADGEGEGGDGWENGVGAASSGGGGAWETDVSPAPAASTGTW